MKARRKKTPNKPNDRTQDKQEQQDCESSEFCSVFLYFVPFVLAICIKTVSRDKQTVTSCCKYERENGCDT